MSVVETKLYLFGSLRCSQAGLVVVLITWRVLKLWKVEGGFVEWVVWPVISVLLLHRCVGITRKLPSALNTRLATAQKNLEFILRNIALRVLKSR